MQRKHNQVVVCNSGKDSHGIKHLMNFSHSLNKPSTIRTVDTTDSSKPETWTPLPSMIIAESFILSIYPSEYFFKA